MLFNYKHATMYNASRFQVHKLPTLLNLFFSFCMNLFLDFCNSLNSNEGQRNCCTLQFIKEAQNYIEFTTTLSEASPKIYGIQLTTVHPLHRLRLDDHSLV